MVCKGGAKALAGRDTGPAYPGVWGWATPPPRGRRAVSGGHSPPAAGGLSAASRWSHGGTQPAKELRGCGGGHRSGQTAVDPPPSRRLGGGALPGRVGWRWDEGARPKDSKHFFFSLGGGAAGAPQTFAAGAA